MNKSLIEDTLLEEFPWVRLYKTTTNREYTAYHLYNLQDKAIPEELELFFEGGIAQFKWRYYLLRSTCNDPGYYLTKLRGILLEKFVYCEFYATRTFSADDWCLLRVEDPLLVSDAFRAFCTSTMWHKIRCYSWNGTYDDTLYGEAKYKGSKLQLEYSTGKAGAPVIRVLHSKGELL